jgi:hypothetical protein
MMTMYYWYNRLDLLAQDKVDPLAEAKAKAKVQIENKLDQILGIQFIKIKICHRQVITRTGLQKAEVYSESNLCGHVVKQQQPAKAKAVLYQL